MVRVLSDGTYLSALIKPSIRGQRRERLLAAARAGLDLSDINAVPDAFDERGLPVIHLARVIEYDVPDRDGNGTGELIVLLTTILHPAGNDGARADELAAAYHQRWEHETANDQLKTHLRGPGRVLRSRLPDLVHQEIWAYLIVHHAISALTARASAAADLDPDRISFAQALRLIRRTATGTADIPPTDWADRLPVHLAMIGALLIPPRRERTCPRAVKRARRALDEKIRANGRLRAATDRESGILESRQAGSCSPARWPRRGRGWHVPAPLRCSCHPAGRLPHEQGGGGPEGARPPGSDPVRSCRASSIAGSTSALRVQVYDVQIIRHRSSRTRAGALAGLPRAR